MEMPITQTRPAAIDVQSLDPYHFFAVLGKQVIHPGGRRSTHQLFHLAGFQPHHRVLDAGCGVATTAIHIVRTAGASVTAVDNSPIMLDRARANIRQAGLEQRVRLEEGDILALPYPDNTFDRVVAEAVTMFVDRPRAAAELIRVCRPGGMVLATEFFWRKPPTVEAREIFLGQVCPGLQLDNIDGWVRIYAAAGLGDIQVRSGPFDTMNPRGWIEDEGTVRTIACMVRGLANRANRHKLAWLMPRVMKVVPYLGYILVAGVKPAAP